MASFKNTLTLSILLVSFLASAQFIQVDDTYSAQQLVEDVLIDSPCANVSNFSVSGDTFSGSEQSFGYFTNTSPDFPFTNGIVLSTARASRSEGPNSNLIDEGSTSWVGDLDLENALGIQGTVNATILEFDFTPLTSHISFDYIFASEEYHDDAPCQYSDGFAFLLRPVDGSAPYQNLALIPNTQTPVLVTTVHPEIPGDCPAINEEYFDSFNPTNSPINFNGQTVVLTAQATVIPGTTYHIKLVIADQQNVRYDSAIFLEGGSFNVGTDIGPERLFVSNNPVCEGENHILDATEAGSNSYQWFKDGAALSGQTDPQFTVTEPGDYSVEIDLGSGCIATGEATIEYSGIPIVNSPVTLVQCDDNGDGTTQYDLTQASDLINSFEVITFYENLSDAQNQVNQIQDPQSFLTNSNLAVARVENMYGCAAFADIDLQIADEPLPAQDPVEICDSNNDGIGSFTLSAQVTPALLASLPSGLTVEYYLTETDAVAQQNQLPDSFTNTTPNQQIIFARIINGPACYGIIDIKLIVNYLDPTAFQDTDEFLCDGGSVTLAIPNIYQSYVWNNGETTNSTVVTSGGTYSVAVTDANGCSATKTFIVTASGPAVFTNADIADFAGDQNTVNINYTGLGNYEFSLDGVTFQPSPLFNNVTPGEYQVFINDINGCGSVGPFSIFVLDYPRFFTPNGDGYNDFWRIKNLEAYPDAVINIFDRYGQLIHSSRSGGIGWNGMMDSESLPSTDYWFMLTFSSGRTIKSHFTLKR